MDRALASAIAHRWHPVAAPVSEENLHLLLRHLGPGGPAEEILDLGCGSGEWLLAALQVHPGATAVGVDLSEHALAQARRKAAAEPTAGERVRFEQADAAAWTGGRSGRILCVGAAHAFGGLRETLVAVRRHLRPGGQVLLGDGFWEQGPSRPALDVLGAEAGELPDLGGLVTAIEESGFEVGYGHISTAAEWDRYEWSWTGALTAWALEEADEEDRAAALDLARAHRRQWIEGYRGELGFVTLVLHDTADR